MVEKFEEDFDKMCVGEGQDIAYSTVTGLKPDLSGAQSVPELLKEKRVEGVEGTSEDASDREEAGEEESSDSDMEEEEEEEGEEGKEVGRRENKAITYVHPRGHEKRGIQPIIHKYF